MVRQSSIFFDAKDYELLTMVNRFKGRDSRIPQEEDQFFFHSALHPRGIKELTMSQEIRIAYAVINLLDTLDTGQAQDRIDALRALRTEVLAAPASSFRYNTGRVLIQIMKNLIRAHGHPEIQLRLAHDFRKTASGNRRVVRRMLKRYYLLEMPEAWNQIAFDNHVHDANTKGRKSPTHLIMDAWIKGLRMLDVVYYNFVEPVAVSELLQAADIMSIEVRIGVEFQARFRDRFVQFIWQPQGFTDWRDMLAFFQEKPTQHLMRMGREASAYHHTYVHKLLEQYNTRLRYELGVEYGVRLTEISQQEVLSFVGIGQTSRTHLAELIYRRLITAFDESMPERRARHAKAGPEEKHEIDGLIQRVNDLSPERLNSEWFSKARNPMVFLASDPEEKDKLPEIMRLLPMTLIDWLTSIRTPCHITLNLTTLTVEDVLELLYSCEGMISHLEMFNLKNYEDGKMADLEAISELQSAINEGSAIALKRLIRSLIKKTSCLDAPESDERCQLFLEILRNIPKLQSFYAKIPLGTCMGSDSTSRSAKVHGMGFAFLETLPARARKTLKAEKSLRRRVPFSQQVYRQMTYYPRRYQPLGIPVTRMLRKIPGMRNFAKLKKETWEVDEKSVHYDVNAKDITTLGGFQRDAGLDFKIGKGVVKPSTAPLGLDYLNTTFKNVCKVVFGFSLAMATFQYTQSWWFLIWFGPFIWFFITGFRNVIQAVLGGGGLSRTPLLRWNDYLSWSRLCDSLMYTGISVPLLELGVRTLLLGKVFGITSATNPVVFFTVMSLINGLYISSHNIFRGLPREAVIGNIFRSGIAIPVSIFYSFVAAKLFQLVGLPEIYLVQGAAVISKLASDTVAGLIEGLADKAEYLRRRHWDYVNKFDQLFSCITRFELLMPEEDVVELLRRPKDFIQVGSQEAKELEKIIIVNALDLMYFWMYQPRARSTLIRRLSTMTQDEREIFANSQIVLTRVHEVSQMLVDGLVGIKFARALAFYLARHEEYLEDIAKLTGVQHLAQDV